MLLLLPFVLLLIGVAVVVMWALWTAFGGVVDGDLAFCGGISVIMGLLMYSTVMLPWRFSDLSNLGIDDTDRMVGVCLSLIIWAYIFVFAVGCYDGTGTYSPAWLEYLG